MVLPSVEGGDFMFNVKDPRAIAKGFFALGVPQIVIKLGAKGSVVYTHDGSIEVPGFHVEHVVDPVGARRRICGGGYIRTNRWTEAGGIFTACERFGSVGNYGEWRCGRAPRQGRIKSVYSR